MNFPCVHQQKHVWSVSYFLVVTFLKEKFWGQLRWRSKTPIQHNSVLGTCLLGGDRPWETSQRWILMEITWHQAWKGTISKGKFFFQPWILRGYVSFSGGYCISLAMKSKDVSSIIPSAFKKLLNLQKNGEHIGKWQPCFFVKELFEYLLSSQHPGSCQKQATTNLTAKQKNTSLAFPN